MILYRLKTPDKKQTMNTAMTDIPETQKEQYETQLQNQRKQYETQLQTQLQNQRKQYEREIEHLKELLQKQREQLDDLLSYRYYQSIKWRRRA